MANIGVKTIAGTVLHGLCRFHLKALSYLQTIST